MENKNEIIIESEQKEIKQIIKLMEDNEINKFNFKKSYMNTGYYFLKLVNKNNYLIEDYLITEQQTKYLFDCLFLNYPQTILFNIFEVDFKRINKKKELLNELKTIGTSNNKLNEFKEMFKI